MYTFPFDQSREIRVCFPSIILPPPPPSPPPLLHDSLEHHTHSSFGSEGEPILCFHGNLWGGGQDLTLSGIQISSHLHLSDIV